MPKAFLSGREVDARKQLSMRKAHFGAEGSTLENPCLCDRDRCDLVVVHTRYGETQDRPFEPKANGSVRAQQFDGINLLFIFYRWRACLRGDRGFVK